MDTMSVKLENGIVVTVESNDPAIVDNLIPRYEITASVDGSPLLDPKTRRAMIYGVWDEHGGEDMHRIMQHFASLEIGRLRVVK